MILQAPTAPTAPTPRKSHYDVIVVGAGLGGLSAATRLAQCGRSVLLLERHNLPGGAATSFVRGRFEFEVSLHELSGIGQPENQLALYRYLKDLGVAQRIEFITIPDMFRSVYPGQNLLLPVGVEAYEATVCEAFPHEATGIRTFLGRVRATMAEAWEAEKILDAPTTIKAVPRFGNLLRYLTATWGSILNRDVQDPHARAVLSQYWGYLGNAVSKAPFLYMSGVLMSYMKYGPVYIKGRSQALSNAFVAAFEEFGGELRLSSAVASITTSNGRVDGVTTEHGERIRADVVISNGDPITTCNQLIGKDKIPAGFFRSLKPRTVGPSAINVYLGLACPPEEVGLTDHASFIAQDYDLESQWEATNHVAPPRAIAVTVYNNVDPSFSPPGTTALTLTALSYGEPWTRIPPEEYVNTKTRIAQAMISMAEQLAPNLRDHIEVVEVATPITNMRYAGAQGGSIYGFDNHAFDHTVLRMSQRGPLGGLYFVGGWTQPGCGFEPCMMSGKMVARDIMRRHKGESR